MNVQACYLALNAPMLQAMISDVGDIRHCYLAVSAAQWASIEFMTTLLDEADGSKARHPNIVLISKGLPPAIISETVSSNDRVELVMDGHTVAYIGQLAIPTAFVEANP